MRIRTTLQNGEHPIECTISVIGNDFEHSYELCVISVCHHDSAAGADASKLKSAEAHAGPRGRPSYSFLRKKSKNKNVIFFKVINYYK